MGTILSMLGHQLDDKMLKEIIDEVDEDGSGELEFEEFTQLAARFLVEEDAEAMQQELKEAFRLYVGERLNFNLLVELLHSTILINVTGTTRKVMAILQLACLRKSFVSSMTHSPTTILTQ